MGGGGSIVTGYEYFGGLAQLICAGEITRLTRIANGDTVIWEGDVDQTSRDGDGKTALSTNIGTLYLYWGRTDQVANANLVAALVDFGTGPTTVPIPAWRHTAYVVSEEVQFGNQPVPPTLTFDFERNLDHLALTEHELTGDAVLPEVLYDLFVSALYSVGLAPALLDDATFIAAAETIIDEDLGVSPILDEATTLRDFVGTLLNYLDAVAYFETGLIKLKLIRPGETPVDIGAEDLAEEPQITNGSLADTWNFTRLTFTDRENNFAENAVEPYDDHANAAIQGENIPKDLELPFVTRRAVAKFLAKRKALAGGRPRTNYELTLLPSFRSLRAGTLLSLTFPKLGLTAVECRVMDIQDGGSKNQTVRVEALSEITRAETNDYVPPADPIFNLGAFYDPNGNPAGQIVSATPRLLWLPDGLQGSKADGFLVAFARPGEGITKWQCWWTWDPNQKAYKKLEAGPDFPIGAELRSWTRTRNNTRWLLRIEFETQHDVDYLSELTEEGQDVYLVTARRLYKATGSTINQHQVDGLWFQTVPDGRFEALDGLLYDIEVTDEAFNSLAPILETAAGQGRYPCLVFYAGRSKDLFYKATDTINFERNAGNAGSLWSGSTADPDTELKRWFKVVTGTKQEVQDIADVTAVTYDRDLTTMCPDGTYSREWGIVVLTLAEQYDFGGFAVAFNGVSPYDDLVADVDAGLFADVFEIATTEQVLVIEHTNAILAFMIITGADYYNTTTA